MIKRLFCLLLALSLSFAFAGCGKTEKNGTTEANEPADNTEYLSGTYRAEITVRDYGVIKLELDADTAPITVTNFVKLARSGFYDGLTFHRIYSGFMIQGGDPKGNGTGSSDPIKGEFSANGVENDISHVRGTVSMARRGDSFDSGSCQFFIVHEDSLFLDGQYAGFGHVTEGMDVVDAICADAKPIDGNGMIDLAEQPIIESVRIIE